jgi:hypothetical protein
LTSRLFRAAEERWWVLLPVILIAVAVFAFIAGILVMALWNWLMPDIFGLATITVWQALGLLFLARVLFGLSGSQSKSSRGGGDSRRPKRAHSETDTHGAERDRSEEPQEHAGQPEVDETRTAEFERYWREEGRQAYQRWLERVLEEKKDGGDGGQ